MQTKSLKARWKKLNIIYMQQFLIDSLKQACEIIFEGEYIIKRLYKWCQHKNLTGTSTQITHILYILKESRNNYFSSPTPFLCGISLMLGTQTPVGPIPNSLQGSTEQRSPPELHPPCPIHAQVFQHKALQPNSLMATSRLSLIDCKYI